ncbi:MAG: nucleoside deaminase [Syntrophaceae bacterium]
MSRNITWALAICLAGSLLAASDLVSAGGSPDETNLAALKARIEALKVDPAYPDDLYALETIKEAYAALRSKSGGIGACLVDERSGAVIARGRNRQYSGYFRSDLHAEMDLLNRYEDRVRKPLTSAGGNPRACEGLVLYSSLEPCPMCLTRIINSGIKKLYYVAPDPEGGMVSRMQDLPPFWRRFAQGREFKEARCSPAMRAMAADLFGFSMRSSTKQ